MVNIHFVDNDKLISNTQRMKLRKRIRENPDVLLQSSQEILNMIHFSDEGAYSKADVVVNDPENIQLVFGYDTTKQDLRMRLRDKIHAKGRDTDPCWKEYRKLVATGARFIGQEVPTPSEIRRKHDFYKKEMEQLQAILGEEKTRENPYIQYILNCLSSLSSLSTQKNARVKSSTE